MYASKRSRVAAILAALFICVCPAMAGTVTLNFDDIPEGFLPVDALQAYGIDSFVSSAGSYPAAVYRCGEGCANVLPGGSGSFLATAGGSYPAPTGYFTTTLTFHDPTPYFSFFKSGYSVGSFGVAGWQADAYDSESNLVASVGVGLAFGLDYPPSPTPVSYTLSGEADITSVVFTSHYNYWSTAGSVQVANFSYDTPEAVPEPATVGMALLGLGLTIRGVSARRRRSR